MKTIKSGTFLYIALFLIVGTGCKQDVLNKPIVINNNKPGVVSGINITNLHGKATLTYILPDDKDLLYIKAVYQTAEGRPEQVIKASRYTNTLTLVGFGDTLAHAVQLYAVNSSEVASTPVSITVNPLTPAINLARRSLKVTATFGGFDVSCKNPTQENLAIIPLVDTTGTGKWTQTSTMQNIYSNSDTIVGSNRGQPAIARKYAFLVRDRWLNYSDTLFTTITPLFEKLLPKSIWRHYALPGDAVADWVGNGVSNIFNGTFNRNFISLQNAISPQNITLDLGKAYIFSRLLLSPYLEGTGLYFTNGSPKIFEIWGSNQPNPNGALDASWTKLVTCTVIKPSGSPYGVETGADRASGKSGWQFNFPVGAAPYRYVRIRYVINWQGSYMMALTQFTLWGQE
ncbi:protein of unknown function [Pedobacter steynii]|uniref:F5/8 type C domain-containing protein n=1 Tax=Pedobacter steynii TaxID=430522 RepID=A0A1H0G125_9SPHI|nr:DUF5000 domain-containing lipoprotein [Pedobacter steynii]NQX42287.1 DUF4959 domain-containing protein [Pedobacter steynii]SDO00562.1 protein of unknown function [Pedobacter steynii]